MKLTINNEQVYLYTNNKEIDSSKPSVMFIHGAGFDHSVWTLFARHFSRHNWNVLAIDLPGTAARRVIRSLQSRRCLIGLSVF